MSAQVYEVTQYAASCTDCHWEGAVYDDNEAAADREAGEHNHEKHDGPAPREDAHA